MNYDKTLSMTLFHILLVAPILIYIGYYKTDAGPNAYFSLLALSVLVFGYHFMQLITNYISNNPTSINLFHLLVIAPLITYISYYKETEGNSYFYLFLLSFGILAAYIHSRILLMWLK